jgi:hypothetical protein
MLGERKRPGRYGPCTSGADTKSTAAVGSTLPPRHGCALWAQGAGHFALDLDQTPH